MARLFFMLLLICLLVQPARADRFYDGLVAYNEGDFRTALSRWRPLAENGDAKAQSSLGFLYYKGLGLRQDYHSAFKWFKRAATGNIVQAQAFLSIMYFEGQGIRQDFRLAYMWGELALGAGYAPALNLRDQAAQDMAPAEIDAAESLVMQWREMFPLK